MSAFANLFGYVLKFLYDIVDNYGIAIILFSVLVKVLMMPITIKQQKTIKINEKMQKELKQIQFKYKGDKEKLNQEVMDLYKRVGTSPLSGCFSAIIQIVLLISVFMLVHSPLTYMLKLDKEVIENLENIVTREDTNKNNAYKEIEVIQYVKNIDKEAENKLDDENNSVVENNIIEEDEEGSIEESENTEFDEVEIFENDEETADIENLSAEKYINKYKDQVNINMDLFGIDLTQNPQQNLSDWKTLILPVLYVISSFVSVKMTTQTAKKKNEQNNLITDGTEEKQEEEYNPMQDAGKTMTWMMPIMSILIAVVAPLGLVLYWLMNNILMIIEKILFNKIFEKEEEAN